MKLNSRVGLLSVSFGLIFLVPAVALTSPSLPFTAPATFESAYKGTGWCGGGVTLTLHANGTFVGRVIRGGWEMSDWSGTWHSDRRDRLTLAGGGSNNYYRIVDAKSLEPLDALGHSSDSRCNTRLTRSSRIVDFSGVMRPVTLSSDVWTLFELHGKNVTVPIGAKPPRLMFDVIAKRITGSMGCNNLSGTFVQDGSRLKLSPRPQTRMRCEPRTDAMEAGVLAALERTTAFHICCSALELRDGGTVLATFRTTR